LKSSSMLSTRQLYRSNNQPANYAALTQFAPEPDFPPNLGRKDSSPPNMARQLLKRIGGLARSCLCRAIDNPSTTPSMAIQLLGESIGTPTAKAKLIDLKTT
jgi:hypothetical protein